MEYLDKLDYVIWLPLLLWGALYFWFWRFSYPLFMHKMVKKGQRWAYVSGSSAEIHSRKAKLRLLNFVFSLIASVALSVSVCWVFRRFGVCEPVYGFVAIAPAMILAAVLYSIAMGRIAAMFTSAYFLEYRRVRYETESKGTFMSEPDIHNRTIWSYNKKLRHAQEHRRFWKYVRAMAKTKKIPPDVYAETMY